MKKQQGSITTVVLVILLIVGIALWIDGTSTASPEDVKALVQKAKDTPGAAEIVQSELKKTPTPTKSELITIRHKVDEQLVLSISKAATGDVSLQSGAEKQVEEKKSVEQLNSQISSPIVDWGFKGLIAIIVIWLIIFAVRKKQN